MGSPQIGLPNPREEEAESEPIQHKGLCEGTGGRKQTLAHAHVTDGEIEAQKGDITCPESQNLGHLTPKSMFFTVISHGSTYQYSELGVIIFIYS